MSLRSAITLDRILRRISKLSPPRHRELVRGMMAELDSIPDPVERRRFALGAVAAIGRLAMSRLGRAPIRAPSQFATLGEREGAANPGGPSMSELTTRQLLRRHAVPFVIAFSLLTLLLLSRQAMRDIPQMNASGASVAHVVEALALAVPFTVALTVPMSVFLSVIWVFTRLGKEGVLARSARQTHGLRRLVTPVLGAAAVVAALTFVSNTQIVPRANARYAILLDRTPSQLNDRTMTIGQLWEATRRAQMETGPEAAAVLSGYRVEIHKKFALAGASVFLALLGAAIAIRFPHGGTRLVLGASGVVFVGYYMLLMGGESLAEGQAISPFVAMWMANVVALVLVLLLAWRPGYSGPQHDTETLALGG